MKKFFKRFFLTSLLMVLLVVFLTACNKEHVHEFGEWITVKHATCTEEGKQERYCFCLEKETEVLAALGHQPSEAANCVESQYCLVCNAVLDPAKNHQFGNYIITKNPTCTEKGEKERSCANCEEKQTQTLYPTGHSHGDWIIVKEATCEEDGIREQFCACGDKRTSTIQALGHNFTEWSMIKEASCTEEGRKERYCFCGKKEMQIIPIFHPYNEVIVKEATKFEDGLKELTCPLCQNKTEVIIPAIVSHGLAYRINSDGVTCTIIGIGTCTDEDVIIPKTIDGYTVTSIAQDAFRNCLTMVTLTIPSTVSEIGDFIVMGAKNLTTLYYNTDYECSSSSVFMNASFRKVVIGGSAIPALHSQVEEVVLPETITALPDRAFSGCRSLKTIVIPQSVKSIGAEAFYNCSSLTEINLPANLEYIGNRAFQYCHSLTSITIPERVTEISDHMFDACQNLTEIKMHSGITRIGDSAFSGCKSITSITIPESVREIGGNAFGGCDFLTEIIVPEGVTVIGERFCMYSDGIKTITLPKSITKICDDAFLCCENLHTIFFGGTKAEWKAIEKEKDWKALTSLSTVVCIDGKTAP